MAGPRRLGRPPTRLGAGPPARAQHPVHLGGARPGPPVAVDHLADGPPRRRQHPARDRPLRPGSRRRRRAVSALLDRCRGCRPFGRGVRTAPHPPAAGRCRAIRVLAARHLRARPGGPPALPRGVPGVQPGHGPSLGPERVDRDRLAWRSSVPAPSAVARAQAEDGRGDRPPAGRRAAPPLDPHPPAEPAIGAGLRSVRGAAEASPARAVGAVHEPRRVGDAPLLGGPLPARLQPGRLRLRRRMAGSVRDRDRGGDDPRRRCARPAGGLRRSRPAIPPHRGLLDGTGRGPGHAGPRSAAAP